MHARAQARLRRKAVTSLPSQFNWQKPSHLPIVSILGRCRALSSSSFTEHTRISILSGLLARCFFLILFILSFAARLSLISSPADVRTRSSGSFLLSPDLLLVQSLCLDFFCSSVSSPGKAPAWGPHDEGKGTTSPDMAVGQTASGSATRAVLLPVSAALDVGGDDISGPCADGS